MFIFCYIYTPSSPDNRIVHTLTDADRVLNIVHGNIPQSSGAVDGLQQKAVWERGPPDHDARLVPIRALVAGNRKQGPLVRIARVSYRVVNFLLKERQICNKCLSVI